MGKKLGDIFEFRLNENTSVYYQYLGTDNYQLKSDCLLFFDFSSSPEEEIDIEKLRKCEIWFIKLSWIEQGVRDKFYKKIGNSAVVMEPSGIKFKNYVSNFFDLNTNQFREAFSLRFFNQPTTKEFNNVEEYRENTKDAWDDGAMFAQGLKDKVLHELYGSKN